MSLEVFSIMHIIDVIWSTNSVAIALHVFEFSRDWASLGAIFTTTTRNLCVCDVIMKMVYCDGSVMTGSYLSLFSFLAHKNYCLRENVANTSNSQRDLTVFE